jgi:hypothetical protein
MGKENAALLFLKCTPGIQMPSAVITHVINLERR